MKVKELVEKLLEVDQELEVITISDNPELHQALERKRSFIPKVIRVKERKETFRDMMDGCAYTTTVLRYAKDGEDGSFEALVL